MSTPIVYVLCGQNCKYESMTKEQILAAIIQAVNEGTIGNIDTGFITTVKTITGTPLSFFVGTQDEYEALTDAQKTNLFAIITNDTTKEGLERAVETLVKNYETLIKNYDDLINDLCVNGTKVVKKADFAAEAATLKGGIDIDLAKIITNTSSLSFSKTYERQFTSEAELRAVIPDGLYILGVHILAFKSGIGRICESYACLFNLVPFASALHCEYSFNFGNKVTVTITKENNKLTLYAKFADGAYDTRDDHSWSLTLRPIGNYV